MPPKRGHGIDCEGSESDTASAWWTEPWRFLGCGICMEGEHFVGRADFGRMTLDVV